MRRVAALLIGALCFVRGATAQPPAQPAPPRPAPPKSSPPKGAAPDLAFLEYLGSWQGDDDEWIAIKEWDQDGAAKGRPPAAPGKPRDEASQPKEPAPQGAGNDHDKAQ
jgi:hypothetical protein